MAHMKQIITLADASDTYNFRPGMPIAFEFLPDGTLVRQSRFRAALHTIWRWLTSPIRQRHVVSAVDVNAGTVTIDYKPKWYRFL